MFVTETYGRTYNFQQQDGCKSRGTFKFKVPYDGDNCEYENDTVPEIINGNEMGVSFKAWLARDPKAPVAGRTDYGLDLWWKRNFYPDIGMIISDLHQKGILEAGEYLIDIDW